jgi:hypothetical protein
MKKDNQTLCGKAIGSVCEKKMVGEMINITTGCNQWESEKLCKTKDSVS